MARPAPRFQVALLGAGALGGLLALRSRRA